MSGIEYTNHLMSQRQALEYFALSLTANKEDAQDLMQDTYVKAIAYQEKFKEATNLKAWLYTIMKNTFINKHRRKVQTKTIINQSEDSCYLNNAPDRKAEHPSSAYTAKEIKHEISLLQEEYRLPFTMYHDGYRYKEIADELQLPIGTVKSRIFLARQKLMNSLSEFNPN